MLAPRIARIRRAPTERATATATNGILLDAMPKYVVVRQDELLVQAASRGEVEKVREMLDHRASASAQNNLMLTALHWAVTMGHREVVELLIERGASVQAKSQDGNTPLHMAAREGDAEIVEALLELNADPSALNESGQTPLELAQLFAEDEPEVMHALQTALARRQAATLLKATKTPALPLPVGLEATPGAADEPKPSVDESHGTGGASVGCGTDDLEALMAGLVGQMGALTSGAATLTGLAEEMSALTSGVAALSSAGGVGTEAVPVPVAVAAVGESHTLSG